MKKLFLFILFIILVGFFISFYLAQHKSSKNLNDINNINMQTIDTNRLKQKFLAKYFYEMHFSRYPFSNDKSNASLIYINKIPYILPEGYKLKTSTNEIYFAKNNSEIHIIKNKKLEDIFKDLNIKNINTNFKFYWNKEYVFYKYNDVVYYLKSNDLNKDIIYLNAIIR